MASVFLERPDPLTLRVRTLGWGQVGVWLPPVLAMAMIAVESTGSLSASHTNSWLRPIFERIFGPVSGAAWAQLHHAIRKTGHFVGYGLVCLTFLRAWLLTLARRMDLSTRMWRLQSCALAVGCTAVVASLDEWHQTFLPSRTGQVSDVGIDTMGALMLCGVVGMICWRGGRQDLEA